jgi:hypothetical protein
MGYPAPLTGLLVLLSAVDISTACSCDHVQLLGHYNTLSQSYLLPAMGIYVKGSTTYNSKPVYEQVDGSRVIYWYPDHNQWYVGDATYTNDILMIYRNDHADTGCPTDDGNGWTIKFWEGSAWSLPSPYLHSKCVTDCAHSSLRVAGAEMFDPSTSGTYSKVAGVTKEGRPVWKKDGADYFLYYHQVAAGDRWRLGTTYDGSTDAIGSGYVADGETDYCPADITTWEAWSTSDGAWELVGMSVLLENALPTSSCGCDTATVDATGLTETLEGEYILLPGVHSP